MEKLFTLKLTDSELDTIYDALEEFRNSIDSEVDIENANQVQFKIYEACKVV